MKYRNLQNCGSSYLLNATNIYIRAICIQAIYIRAICIRAICIRAICIQAICIQAIYIQAIYIQAIYIQAIYIQAIYIQAIYIQAIYIQALQMYLVFDKTKDLGASQERKLLMIKNQAHESLDAVVQQWYIQSLHRLSGKDMERGLSHHPHRQVSAKDASENVVLVRISGCFGIFALKFNGEVGHIRNLTCCCFARDNW
jgi:hypothetical protein